MTANPLTETPPHTRTLDLTHFPIILVILSSPQTEPRYLLSLHQSEPSLLDVTQIRFSQENSSPATAMRTLHGPHANIHRTFPGTSLLLCFWGCVPQPEAPRRAPPRPALRPPTLCEGCEGRDTPTATGAPGTSPKAPWRGLD